MEAAAGASVIVPSVPTAGMASPALCSFSAPVSLFLPPLAQAFSSGSYTLICGFPCKLRVSIVMVPRTRSATTAATAAVRSFINCSRGNRKRVTNAPFQFIQKLWKKKRCSDGCFSEINGANPHPNPGGAAYLPCASVYHIHTASLK